MKRKLIRKKQLSEKAQTFNKKNLDLFIDKFQGLNLGDWYRLDGYVRRTKTGVQLTQLSAKEWIGGK